MNGEDLGDNLRVRSREEIRNRGENSREVQVGEDETWLAEVNKTQ